ncbi:hypothetical protein I4U23_011727 [Adineta vaga]|nr:hypothetical protein I4U23_011727 [Adineta vaga]
MKLIWVLLLTTAVFLAEINGKKFNRLNKSSSKVNKDETIYENKQHGFTLSIPKDWSATDIDELSRVIRMSNSLIDSHKEKFAHHLASNWSIDNINPLFCFSKYPINQLNGQLNPNILAISENLNVYRNIQQPCDYFNITQDILQTLSLNIKLIGKCKEVKINEETFSTQNVQTRLPGVPLIKQTLYVKIVENNQLLLFTLSYFNRNSRMQLENIIKTFKFIKN